MTLMKLRETKKQEWRSNSYAILVKTAENKQFLRA